MTTNECEGARLALMAALDGEGEPTAAQRQHLAACAECRQWHAQLQALSTRLDGLPYPAADVDLWPRMEGRLVHYQYDTFRTELTDGKLENALVTFQLDPHGKVERAKMVAASPLADFSYDYQHLDLRPVGDAK